MMSRRLMNRRWTRYLRECRRATLRYFGGTRKRLDLEALHAAYDEAGRKFRRSMT